MMRISRPLTPGQAKEYHKTQFANAKEEYYSQGAAIVGEWDGRLAAAWGLVGPVAAEHFSRLSDGQDPRTGAQLIRHIAAHDRIQPDGSTKKTVEHRAGWDLTLSAPKSVSLTALIGGDDRVRQAHREAVNHALRATEAYTQARVGSGQSAETTGRWAAATFEHDSSRPVDGYAAPQLHTHVVVFNMTQMANGKMRSLQPLEIYRTTAYATAVYRSVLATRLQGLGYDVERGEHNEPSIRGFSQGYLDASSPRSEEVKAYLEQNGLSGQRATEIATLSLRAGKHEALSPEEMLNRHAAIAERFGHEATVIAEAALARGPLERQADRGIAERAMDYSTARNTEREASPDGRAYLRDALVRAMGEASAPAVHQAFDGRIASGRLVERPLAPGRAGHAYTTPEMQRLERDVIQTMLDGRGKFQPLVRDADRVVALDAVRHLSSDQREAFRAITKSRDLVYVLDGVAGAGKTVALAVVRTAAEGAGYQVEGLAPTGRAAHKLHAESGMPTQTLQKHLQSAAPTIGRHLYVLDESSLASTDQMHKFIHRLGREDRVLLVGDTRQHQAVDAGRPFDQLQQAGVAMSTLTEIHRQKPNTALLEVVEQLSAGQISEGLNTLDRMGRIHEIESRAERLAAVAQAYVERPKNTLVVAADNESRQLLNTGIRQALRESGRGLHGEDEQVRVLAPRNDLTGEDRGWAGKYAVDDVLRYAKKSETYGVTAGEYVRVTAADPKTNQLTVERQDGSTLRYQANRLMGVSVYRATERPFAVGDRVQFTAPVPSVRVTNRALGTACAITQSTVKVKLDDGRVVKLSRDQALHLEHGYALTSHSSQGQSVNNVLLFLDPERAGAPLVNRRLAYVAVSRARHDAQIFTDNTPRMFLQLNRQHDKSTAHDVQPAQTRRVEQTEWIGYGR